MGRERTTAGPDLDRAPLGDGCSEDGVVPSPRGAGRDEEREEYDASPAHGHRGATCQRLPPNESRVSCGAVLVGAPRARASPQRSLADNITLPLRGGAGSSMR